MKHNCIPYVKTFILNFDANLLLKFFLIIFSYRLGINFDMSIEAFLIISIEISNKEMQEELI